MKNKILYSLTVLLLSLSIKAQVGINTDSPTKMLDINGYLRLRVTTYPTAPTIDNYDQVLVTDDNGNIEYWDKSAIIEEFKKPIVETKKLYFSSSPTGNNTVTCGKINLRFNASTRPEINLLPNVVTGATIYVTRTRMSAIDNKNIYGNIPITIPTNATYDSNWTRIDHRTNTGTTTTGYALNNKDEYFFSYPGEISFYRITFLARTMTSTLNSYTMICEKF